METVDVKLPSALLRAANLEERSLFIARIRSRSDALLSCATRRWRLSWISPRSTVSPLRYSFEDLEEERQSADRLKA
jgi:hypothetical protein